MAIVIAEFCQNHNGDRGVLREQIQAAAAAGADVAKIQTIRSSELTYRERFETGAVENGVTRCIRRPYAAELERLQPLDLDAATHEWFGDECARAGIEPMTTVFTRAAVPFVASLGWNSVKVASYDCASVPLLADLRLAFDRVFVSTGATLDDEVAEAAAVLRGGAFSFLHCVTIYPTPLHELHLARLNFLRQFTPSVGFSDHTLVARDGIKGSVAAIALGADVIERHFTVLASDQTKDGPVSIGPDALAELVKFARAPLPDVQRYVAEHVPEAAAMLGEARRPMSDGELLNRDYYRGRFASKIGDRIVFNWEPVEAAELMSDALRT